MRRLTPDSVGRWIQVAALLAVTALAWGVLIPGSQFWAGIVATGLVGSAAATAVLVRSRSTPTLAEVITAAEAKPAGVPGGSVGGAALRRERGRP